MSLKKLDLTRFETRVNEQGYYSFGTRIGSKEFIYLQTNPKQMESIESWQNNFSSAYLMKKNNGETIFLISVWGFSSFSVDWKNRKDYPLNRKDDEYRKLERFEGDGNLSDLENLFLELTIPKT